MKKSLFLALLFIVLVFSAAYGFAQEKPRLGVLRFTNQTRAGWWSASVGRELQDMLAAELAATKSFQVLERKEIDAVLGEQDLGDSGRIDSATKAKIGRIKGAKYLVAGTVSAFEEGTKGTGGGVSIGRIGIGGKSERAYLAVDLKIIDTETGEIVDARTVEAEAKSGGLRGRVGIGKFSGSLGAHEKTPTGRAIRACLMEIVEYLECSMIKGPDDRCMKEYEAKERKRREKTKKGIKF